MSESAPGWHPDPQGRHEHRFWDGTAWTDQVSDGGVVSTDPVVHDEPAGGAGSGQASDETVIGAGSLPGAGSGPLRRAEGPPCSTDVASEWDSAGIVRNSRR